jgi:hypothetical protein
VLSVKVNEKMMQNISNENSCRRSEDLVTLLYGEAGEREAREFKRHVESCAPCRDELAAFSRVREGVLEWRNQSLPSFEFSQNSEHLFRAAEAAPQKPSAWAALREFFTLSPMWMRAATALAVMVVCALAVFTVAYFSQQPQQVVVVQPVPTGPTAAEVEEMVKRRAAELREREKTDTAVAVKDEVQQEKKSTPAVAPLKAKRAGASAQTLARQQNRVKPDSTLGSQEARQQLAELVQSQKDEDSLPRLSDLLEDSNESN